MASTQILRQRLLVEIENLSAENLQSLLDFAGYLRSKPHHKRVSFLETEQDTNLPPENDPFLNFIGAGDVEPFAEDIDDLLYGSA